MQTYAVRAGYIPETALAVFEAMTADMAAMPDLNPKCRVSCHSVCRALALRHANAKCVDGWFYAKGHEHSWIDLGNGIIADMYPIASSGPLLIDASHWMVPWHKIYIPKDNLLTPSRTAEVDAIAQQLVQALIEFDNQA